MAMASRPIAVRRLLVRVRRYLNEKFPLAQAGVLCAACLVLWVLCGQIDRSISLDSMAVIAATTVTLLFLQLRLFDDVNTYYVTEGRGDIGGASLRGLLAGIVVTTLAIATINLWHGAMLALALATTLLMTVASTILGLERKFGPNSAVKLVLGRLPLFELAPATAFIYLYLTWHTATSRSLSSLEITAVVGVIWAGFDVWKLSRHLGVRPWEPHYDIPWSTVRWLCQGLLALSLVLVVVLSNRAGFSTIYLAYAVAVIMLFAVLARPRQGPEPTKPWWVGLPYPSLMVAGLLVQLLAV
jgi:hypothetical protein